MNDHKILRQYAERRSNLTVFAYDSGVIGRKFGKWCTNDQQNLDSLRNIFERRSPDDTSDSSESEQSNDEATAKEPLTTPPNSAHYGCRIADFKSLGEFLIDVSGSFNQVERASKSVTPLSLGTVQDVSGSTIRGILDEGTLSGLTFIEGHGYRIGQIGAFIRIPLGYTDLFGIVSQVGAGAAPERMADSLPYGERWITIQLAGQARRGAAFERGIAQYPTIGDRIHIVTEQDLFRIYGHENKSFLCQSRNFSIIHFYTCPCRSK